MHDPDYQVQHYEMVIDGLEGRFTVAKLRRFSSSLVLVGSVSDPHASALGRLTDIFRLGRHSRNYADLMAIDGFLMNEFGITAAQEWDVYLQEIRRIQGDPDVIEPFLLTPKQRQTDQRVVLHKAEMNERPYLVGRVGTILGTPAAVWMTLPNEEESAIARLRDVFRIGIRGQTFRDYAEIGRKQGQGEAEILERVEGVGGGCGLGNRE